MTTSKLKPLDFKPLDDALGQTIVAAGKALDAAARVALHHQSRARRFKLWALFWFAFAIAELGWRLVAPPWGCP